MIRDTNPAAFPASSENGKIPILAGSQLPPAL